MGTRANEKNHSVSIVETEQNLNNRELGRTGRTIAVMPAYNAASTLRRTVEDIPSGAVDQIILVDDCSRDNTVQVARELGLTVIEHSRNRGYGGNQKTCYRHARDAGADYVVMIHPDYQYDSRIVPVAVEILRLGICDVVLGSRIRTRAEAIAGGMPLMESSCGLSMRSRNWRAYGEKVST